MAASAGYLPIISCSSDDSTYNIIGGIDSISFGDKRVELDNSEMGVAFQKVIAGLHKGRTFTIGGKWSTADTGQARVRTLFGTGAVMYTQVDWTGASGTALDNIQTKVKGYEVKFSNAGLVTWSVDLVMHGVGNTTHHAEAAYTAITPTAGYTSRLTICDTVGGTYYGIDGVKEASLKVERAMLETEDQEATVSVAGELFTAGIYKGSFSCSGDFEADANGQAHIRSGIAGRADRFIKFLHDGTNGWILQTLITSYSIPSTDPKSAVKFSASGQFVTMTATP